MNVCVLCVCVCEQGTIERLQSELRRSQYALEAAKMSREDSDAKLTKTQAEVCVFVLLCSLLEMNE